MAANLGLLEIQVDKENNIVENNIMDEKKNTKDMENNMKDTENNTKDTNNANNMNNTNTPSPSPDNNTKLTILNAITQMHANRCAIPGKLIISVLQYQSNLRRPHTR